MKYERLTAEEETALAYRWRDHADECALHRLVSTHMGLVNHIAQQMRHSGIPFEDLLQEGAVGLMKAARKLDPSKSRLVTYGSMWIKAYMIELILSQRGPVRIGTNAGARKVWYHLNATSRELESHGINATHEAIANALNVPVADVVVMRQRMRPRDASFDDFRAGERGIASTFADEQPSPEQETAENEQQAQCRDLIRRAIGELSERERLIMEQRHLVEEPLTLAQLGTRLGISRERVRQLEAGAIQRMRETIMDGGRQCAEV